MLKVGAINYINALPFFTALKNGQIPCGVALHSGVPAELNRLLREDEIDASLISSAEYIKNKEKYELLPNFCIAAREKVLSVCLYCRVPLQELEGKKIAITRESASSALLVEVLCHHFWKVTPHFAPLDDPLKDPSAVGILLIGDQCLRYPTLPGYHTIDLAQAWYYATGLPFTFAVLAVRKSIMKEKKDQVIELKKMLNGSLAWAHANRGIILQIAEKQCPVPQETLSHYFNLLHYTMTPSHLQGLEKFHDLSRSMKGI